MQESETGRLERLSIAGVQRDGAYGMYLHAELGRYLVAEIAVLIPSGCCIDTDHFIPPRTGVRAPHWNLRLGVHRRRPSTGIKRGETLSIVREMSMVILTSGYK